MCLAEWIYLRHFIWTLSKFQLTQEFRPSDENPEYASWEL
jgi:hypothetical protein